MMGGFFSLQKLTPNPSKRTLVIGDMARWKTQGRNLPNMDGLRYIDLSALNSDVIKEEDPDIILSPLVSDDFDAVDVAGLLSDLAYNGPYRALTNDLPNTELIKSEVRHHAPQIDFDLVVLPMRAPNEQS